jgi:hypothetical protein
MMNRGKKAAIRMAMISDDGRSPVSAAETLDASMAASVDREDAQDDAGSIAARIGTSDDLMNQGRQCSLLGERINAGVVDN